MKGIVLASGMMMLALACGCAHNVIDGKGSVQTGQYFGDVGVTGNGNQITIERGSRVWKLSIIGHNNTITVQDGVTLNRVEFIGKGNVVNLPDNLLIRTTATQGPNQIVRRPAERGPVIDYLPGEALPPVTPTTTVITSTPAPVPSEPAPPPPVQPREERTQMVPPVTEYGEPPPK